MKVRTRMLNLKYLSKMIIYGLFYLATKQILRYTSANPSVIWSIAIIVLMMDLFYSYLKYQTELVMIYLAEAQNTDIIEKKIKHVEKIDIFKGMTNSLLIPKILLAFDTNNPKEVLNITEIHEHFLKSSLDYLLIYRHSQFKAYAMLEKFDEAKKAHTELMKLKETNIKNKDMKLLYNWEQIESLYQYVLNNYTFSLKLYHNVDIKLYNEREKLQYYFEMYQVATKLNNQRLKNVLKDHILSINKETKLLEKE